MVSPPNYIDLSRTFAPVPQDAVAEDSALQSYALDSGSLRRRDALTWGELLKHPLVILLGEPGSGKTYELQHQATLSSPDSSRFYLRLDELAASGERVRLMEDDLLRFAKWQESSETAVFFLDSVDEAKIRQAADFCRALDRFLELVGRRALARARIVISSRITEWLPTTDGHAILIRFPQSVPGTTKPQNKGRPNEPYPFVVQLLPLDETAVTTYAKGRGVADAQLFLEALDKAHAWELARRPADVNDLLSFWRESGNLGTLTEILAFVCDSQLRKTSDRERSEVLALERAIRGAECLAAATILCRKFIFQIPGETNTSAQAIDALACLPPDWRNEEVRALLNHALFDGASYGHIRFHHRRLSEFLAARWFERLMVQGCPVGELEDLLFDARGSERVLRPSLAAIAAWLCAGAERWNLTVCRGVIEVAPEILLRFGDPATLTVPDRRALLKALLKKADGRKRLWWEHDRATLSRLADGALAAEINELITAQSSGVTLRELGLEIVTAGSLVECSPAVLNSAIADLTKGEVFSTATRALEVVGNNSDLHALAAAAESVERLPEWVCVPLIRLLFPRIWSVSNVFRSLSRMESAGRRGIGWEYILSEHFASETNKENGLPLLKGLLGYHAEDGDADVEFELPSNVRAALAVSNVMLGWPTVSEEEALAIAEVLVRVGRRWGYLGKEDFSSERTERHPRVRERYFRLAAEQFAKERGDTNVSLSSVIIFHEILKPTIDDLSWSLASLKAASSDSERQSALQWSFELWQQTGRSRAGLARIKEAAKAHQITRKQLWKYLHPGLLARARAFWYRRLRYYPYRYRLRMAWHEVQKPFFKLRTVWSLWRYRSKLRSGEYIGWLKNLVSEACGQSRDQWSPSDWSLLEKKRGARCAAAVKEGCRRVWERYEPPLRHERQPGEGATYGTIVGLAGIDAAWKDGHLDFARLSTEDARRATRYALSELNGFTPWFAELIRAQPQAVCSVLTECIAGEWEVPADSAHHNFVLASLAWSEPAAGDLIKQTLMERLADREPKNSDVLRDALCVLAAQAPPVPAALAELAKRRSEEAPADGSSFPQWMALWLQADAHPAIDALEFRLSSTTDPTQTMTAICSNISSRSGYRRPILPNPSWLTPTAMRRFIPLVYRYIRLEDDIDHMSGVAYSPTARDDAQEFRGGLLDRLVATCDAEVGAVLQELLSEPLLSHLFDYIKHLFEKHRDQLAEGRPWRSSDVREFAADYEHEPQTDADLFRIGLRRLLDLKRWIETGDESPREEVNRDNNEAGFRRWLQRRLSERSRGRYVVPQEWEIDGAVRPDLRLVIPNAAPVSLELKIIDERPLHDLITGLETQLVGTYLRDHHARYGIYVLALFNHDRKWDPLEEGPRINSEQMLSVLRKRIEEVLAARADIAGLEVVLIHFSPPNR